MALLGQLIDHVQQEMVGRGPESHSLSTRLIPSGAYKGWWAVPTLQTQ